MPVYVDDANIVASVPNGAKVHTSKWCHMMADTLPELEAFARRLRLSPGWLQMKPSGVHYDLTAPKRRQAVSLGAIEIEPMSGQWLRVVAAAREQYLRSKTIQVKGMIEGQEFTAEIDRDSELGQAITKMAVGDVSIGFDPLPGCVVGEGDSP